VVSIAYAADPFSLTAQSTTGSPQSVSASGSSAIDLVRDVIKNEGAFSALNNQGLNASLRYGGVNNAMQFSKNAAGTSAPVAFPSMFDTNLEQEILTEGLKVTKTFGGHLFVDASISRNDFLQEAAIDHYWTPSAGVGYRFNDRAGLRVGYRGDFGPHFTVTGGDLQFYVNY
jgi:hypothetical protein